MASWESILISALILIGNLIMYLNVVNGDGQFQFLEAMGFSFILVFFFVTLMLITDTSEKVEDTK